MAAGTPTREKLIGDLRDVLLTEGSKEPDVDLDGTPISEPPAAGTTPPAPAPAAPAPNPDDPAPPNGSAGPGSDAPTGTSPVPDQFRSEFANLTPAAAAWLKNGVEIKGTLTKKTQEFAAYKELVDRQVAELQEDAVFTRRIRGIPALAKDVVKLIQKHTTVSSNGEAAPPGAGEEPDPDEGVDPLSLAPAEYRAYEKRRDDRLVKKVREETLAAVHDRYVAPAERGNAIRRLITGQLVVKEGLDAGTVDRAIAIAANHAQKYSITVTPENAVDLVRDFLEAAKHETNESTPPAPAPSGAPAAGASDGYAGPRSLATPPMGGGISPPPTLSFEREGRSPTSPEDYHKAVFKNLSRRFGVGFSRKDLKRLLTQDPEDE